MLRNEDRHNALQALSVSGIVLSPMVIAHPSLDVVVATTIKISYFQFQASLRKNTKKGDTYISDVENSRITNVILVMVKFITRH